MNPCPCNSCALRASWTLEQRGAFDLADDAAFALEGAERGGWKVVLLSAPDSGRGPALRLVRQVEDLTSRRFGRLKVLGRRIVERAGYVRGEWAVRCDCGNELVVSGYRLTKLGVSSCRPCALLRTGRKKAISYARARLARRGVHLEAA